MRVGFEGPVDVPCNFGVIANAIEALVSMHIGKEAGVEAAAFGAMDASAHFRMQGPIFAVEGSFREGKIEVGFDPFGEMFGR